MKTEDLIIRSGVINLRKYGYPSCNADNIFTDQIYKEFFREILISNKGADAALDGALDKLIDRIDGRPPLTDTPPQ